MLPELKFRPSLSDRVICESHPDNLVLPELKFRPSLSGEYAVRMTSYSKVLPELKFRPSLSVGGWLLAGRLERGCCRN